MGDDYSVRFEQLEGRVHALEEEAQHNRAFRQEYYKDRQERIIFETQIRVTMKSVDEKLDKLIEWQEGQVAKPGKRLDSIVEKIILVIVGALVGVLLGRLGLQ